MKTAEVKSILDTLGRSPNKHLGQNFLIDSSVIHSAIEAGGVQLHDTILEIGPGLGALTRELLDKGAQVLAIEQDRGFAEMLGVTFMDRSFRIIHADATTADWNGLLVNAFPESAFKNWKLIANLPYAVTSMLLRKALWNTNPPEIIIVLVQKEVAERAMELTKKGDRKKSRPSLLSLMVALTAKSARIVRNVPARCFYPAPKVQSAVLEIVPMTIAERKERWGIDPEEVMRVAKAGFAHPRKQLASNLTTLRTSSAKSDFEALLSELNLLPTVRSESLSVDDWVALTKLIVSMK